jgi:hypothetical protein
MTLSAKKLCALGAGAITIVFGLVATACANAESDAPHADPDGSASLPPGPDSGPPQVPDASRDAPTDAASRTCSNDDFCHTVLPENQTLQAVWSDGAGIAWAGTKFGAILRFDGTEWKVHASGLGEINSIWGSSPTEIWAAGVRGVYRGTGTTSAAVAFTNTPLEADADVHIMSVWGSSANDIWAVGARTDGARPPGRVYHFTGATTGGGVPVWSLDPLSSEEASAYHRVWGSPGSGVWIGVTQPFGEWGATQEAILRRPASSTKFENVVLPEVPDPNRPDAPIGHIFGAALESDTSVWLALTTVWSRRGFYHGVSTDGGATFTWTVMPYESDEALDYTALAASSSGVWIAGKYGRLAKWDGKTFAQASIELKPLPVIDPFFDVWTATGGEVWAVGKGIALHRAKK